eukprot:TRINITY_DN2122_c0_g1_i6.p1 TRINITY_DN2122_c0_g1~~TRINITY_DN2122_c0_g1_i6.p1  ORF type:complete len:263 (-),score=37.42 TRINITY_DN2122_c0_g1_i6:523-1311(-)
MQSQPFEYYVVLDFEATCDDKTKIEPTEIIEFPSVLFDSKTLQVVDQIQIYVKPLSHPTITPFCTELTGIQQKWVDDGLDIHQTLKKYEDWLKSHNLLDTSVDGKYKFTFVTCGDWDLKTMLPLQFKLIGHKQPYDYFLQWINIKKIFEKTYKSKATGMASMLNGLKIPLEGKHHSGIDDCKNITKIVKKCIEDGAVLDVTTTFKNPPSKAPTLLFADVGDKGGKFALEHLPNKKFLLDFKADQGCNEFVSLLTKEEKPEGI